MTDAMARLRALFEQRLREERAQLQAACDAADAAEMQRIAHSLSGAAGMFGYVAVGDAAYALEDAIVEGEGAALVAALATDLFQAIDQGLSRF